jgi:hypothetical protein
VTRITVLQLDTNFPRIHGDVGCAETFQVELEIVRVPTATVKQVVNANPDQIDLGPFIDAIKGATGDLIATSCGFLSPFQEVLGAECNVPFIASALSQLGRLKNTLGPEDLQIITFDSGKLGRAHLPVGCAAFDVSIHGLDRSSHLRDVIENDRNLLNTTMAAADVCAVVQANKDKMVKGILLECTNLPPYKAEIRKISTAQIYDILTAIEAVLPNAVHSQFL